MKFRPQFSLALLLIVMTFFAVFFARQKIISDAQRIGHSGH